MKSQNSGQRKKGKIAAILAGGLVIGVGGAFTLASWTDSEWVFAGNGTGGPGIGTSTFEVQQDTSGAIGGTFIDSEINPGEALSFGLGALALSPGQTIYAPVALRTTSTSIAGKISLRGAVAATGVTATSPDVLDAPGAGLWSALKLQVVVSDEHFTCDATAMTTETTVVAAGSGLAVGATVEQDLDAAQGNTQYYCFAVTLPAPAPATPGEFDGLQGHVVAPAWEFRAISE